MLVALGALVAACGGAGVADEHADPDLVRMEGALGNRFVSAGQSGTVVARIRVGAHAQSNLPRPAINLALVVDTSGSMEGRPIADARAASLALRDPLADGDRLAVVVFHGRTELLVPGVVLDDDTREEARSKIREMAARGTTDMAGGLRVGLEELLRNYSEGGVNRLVLLGDGVPNDAAPITALAQAAGERHVTITSLGLGLDYDETLMGRIAQLSGGHFHHVEQSSAVAAVFRDEVLRLQRVVGRNAVVTLTPGPGVRIESVVGQVVSQRDGTVSVALGDVSEDDERDLIVRLTADGRRAGANVELIDAVMSFDDAVAGAGRLERRVFLGARATADEAERNAGRNDEVERDAARMSAAATQIAAIALARGGELEAARQVLDRAITQAEERAASTHDGYLADEVSRMRVLSGALPSVASAPAPAPGSAAPAPVATPEDAPATVRRSYERAMRAVEAAPRDE
jgi:Ca-activated chloride channel family protein